MVACHGLLKYWYCILNGYEYKTRDGPVNLKYDVLLDMPLALQRILSKASLGATTYTRCGTQYCIIWDRQLKVKFDICFMPLSVTMTTIDLHVIIKWDVRSMLSWLNLTCSLSCWNNVRNVTWNWTALYGVPNWKKYVNQNHKVLTCHKICKKIHVTIM